MAKPPKKLTPAQLKNQLPLFTQETLFGETGPDRLGFVHDKIKACENCSLCKSRATPICGQGNVKEPIVAIVTGAPGQMEDLSGAPITGRPGIMLDEILAWLGFARTQLFLAHVVACKPPQHVIDRDQVAACRPLLYEQLRAVKPKYIITFGEDAYRSVFYEPKKTDTQVQSAYGTWQVWGSVVPGMGTHSLESLIGRNRMVLRQEAHEHLRRITRRMRDNGQLPPKELDV